MRFPMFVTTCGIILTAVILVFQIDMPWAEPLVLALISVYPAAAFDRKLSRRGKGKDDAQ